MVGSKYGYCLQKIRIGSDHKTEKKWNMICHQRIDIQIDTIITVRVWNVKVYLQLIICCAEDINVSAQQYLNECFNITKIK